MEKLILTLIFIPTLGAIFVPGVEELPYGVLLFFLPFQRYNINTWIPVLITVACSIGYFISNFSLNLPALVRWINVICPLALLYSKGSLKKELNQVVQTLIMIFIPLAILQNIPVVQYTLSTIIEQVFSRSTLGTGYRGASLIYTEPSRAGFYLAQLGLFCLVLENKLKRKRWMTLIVVVMLIFLIRSTTAIYFALLISCFLLLTYNFRVQLVVLCILSMSLIILGDLFLSLNPKIEFLLTSRWSELLRTLDLVSGGRFYAINNIIRMFPGGPIGYGFDSELFYLQSYSSEQVVNGYRQRYSFIPTSIFFYWLHVFGIIFIFLVILVLALVKASTIQILYIIGGFFFYSPPATPLFFLLIIMLTKRGVVRDSE